MMNMNYGIFSKIFKDFKGELYLYISGSQGVSSAEIKVTYGKDFTTLDELEDIFLNFIDENALENIDDYLDDADGDEDFALAEALADSGEFLLGTSSEELNISLNDLYLYH